MGYRIIGLAPEQFQHLFNADEAVLTKHGAKRYTVTETPGFPDRIEMRDCEIGETVVLLNYEHLPVDTPYRSSHAIFVREGAKDQYDEKNKIPDVIARRPISLRAFSADGDMLDAELVDGKNIAELIDRMLSNREVAYLHAHNAKRGCYSARIERA
jgi:hypothetical protein